MMEAVCRMEGQVQCIVNGSLAHEVFLDYGMT